LDSIENHDGVAVDPDAEMGLGEYAAPSRDLSRPLERFEVEERLGFACLPSGIWMLSNPAAQKVR
jgi:hypothetical protein